MGQKRKHLISKIYPAFLVMGNIIMWTEASLRPSKQSGIFTIIVFLLLILESHEIMTKIYKLQEKVLEQKL